MKKLLAILLSISIHLALLYFLMTTNFKIPVEKKKESLKILIKKKESNRSATHEKSNRIIEDISTSSFTQSLDSPETNNYISTSDSPELGFGETMFNNIVNIKKEDEIESFEKSLEHLIPDITNEIVTDYEDVVSFSWHEDSRSLISSINIDFNSFPKTSFTGIGINIEFKVSDRGDVYDVKVQPPGSGSIDFDILMVEYITNLKFSPGERSSSGEIKIVYE